MTAIYWILLAMLWAAISIEFALWFCPRLFQHTQKDGE